MHDIDLLIIGDHNKNKSVAMVFFQCGMCESLFLFIAIKIYRLEGILLDIYVRRTTMYVHGCLFSINLNLI